MSVALNSDMYCSIFSFADMYTLVRCSEVCKEWQNLTSKDVYWKAIFQKYIPEDTKNIKQYINQHFIKDLTQLRIEINNFLKNESKPIKFIFPFDSRCSLEGVVIEGTDRLKSVYDALVTLSLSLSIMPFPALNALKMRDPETKICIISHRHSPLQNFAGAQINKEINANSRLICGKIPQSEVKVVQEKWKKILLKVALVSLYIFVGVMTCCMLALYTYSLLKGMPWTFTTIALILKKTAALRWS